MDSDKMPWCWPPPDDGTSWDESGCPRGGAIAGLLLCLAVALVVAVALIAWASK